MKWNDSSPTEKIFQLSRLLISAIVLTAGILKLLNVWPDGLYLAVPLLGVLQILQAVLSWKQDRNQGRHFSFRSVFHRHCVHLRIFCIKKRGHQPSFSSLYFWISFKKAVPYQAALISPTPETFRNSDIVFGFFFAMSVRVALENTT